MDFSRAINKDITIFENMLFNAVMTYSRSDGGSVDFTSKTIKLDIMTSRGQTPTLTLTSGTEITISTAQLTFSKILTTLTRTHYDFILYNDTDKIAIRYGKFIVI